MARQSAKAPAPDPRIDERGLVPGRAEPLFRAEVMAERQAQWLGTVLLEPKVSHRIFTAFALATAGALIALLFLASYTRKERINGWLVPQQGIVRIFAPQPGVVARIDVREGAAIRRGDPLLVLSTELQSQTFGAARQEIVRRLAKRRDSMADERPVQERLFDEQEADLTRREQVLRVEKQHLAREIELQRARLDLSEQVVARTRLMRARDIIPEPRLEEARKEHLETAAKLQNLERSLAALERGRVEVESTLRALPFKRRTQLAEIERNVAALEQDLTEADLRREIVLTAPQDGTVTAIQAEAGSSAGTAAPLLAIVPARSPLQAQLFSPSSAIGFLRPGQRVLMRYQSFPYQKFGLHEGVVASVSRTAVSPSDLGPQMAGLSSLYAPNQPLYRITVDLARQTVEAYGSPVPLQPGMQLQADVLIESRLLIEWVLDPLYTLTGRSRA